MAHVKVAPKKEDDGDDLIDTSCEVFYRFGSCSLVGKSGPGHGGACDRQRKRTNAKRVLQLIHEPIESTRGLEELDLSRGRGIERGTGDEVVLSYSTVETVPKLSKISHMSNSIPHPQTGYSDKRCIRATQ